MQTLRLHVDPDRLNEPESQSSLERAASILRAGGTVALPTETVYGLGANALNSEAVAAIFEAKERPGWDPLIVHVCDREMLEMVAGDIPLHVEALMNAFWPGPLTLLLPKAASIPDSVTAGRELVGVRMPAHPVALALIRMAGVPVAAPSANRFGHTSPTTAAHVLDDLDGRIDAVVDAGPTEFGVESTVLDVTRSPMIIYRPGAVTLEQIRETGGAVELFCEPQALSSQPREAMPSPGVGLRHYAPKARLILVEGEEESLLENLLAEFRVHVSEKTGLMLPAELPESAHGGVMYAQLAEIAEVFDWGPWFDLEELAHRLFAGLRALDAAGCTVILCPVPPERGIGAAIRDRLRKAAARP